MPKITLTISPETEKKLRKYNRKKGDMSTILNKALEAYFAENPIKD